MRKQKVLIRQFENGRQGQLNTLGYAMLEVRSNTLLWPITSGCCSRRLAYKAITSVTLDDGSVYAIAPSESDVLELVLPSDVPVAIQSDKRYAVTIIEKHE